MKKLNYVLVSFMLVSALAIIPVEAKVSNPFVLTIGDSNNELKDLTITVNNPGTFATELLKQISQWSEVGSLTVIGTLSDEEMELFSRFSQIKKLDLSQTNITTITGCQGLTNLTSVILPSTVEEIGESAFSGCSALSSISTPNVKKVGEYAFSGCSALLSISLPVAKTIGERAFYNCENLNSVSIPEVETLGSGDYDGEVFSRTSIKKISLPKVKYIGGYCFSECYALEEVILPEFLEEIPRECFYYCSNLKTINFPSSLKSIGTRAFEGTSLTTAILPEGLQEIYSAFYGCPLSTISIPSTIQSLSSAFDNCNSIKDVYCYAIVPPTTSGFESSDLTGTTLHVPTFSLTSYMLDDNWYRFNQIVAIEGKINSLNVNQDFAINSIEGLDEKVDLNLMEDGHLTVNASSTLNLGTFVQNLKGSTEYDSDSESNYYTGYSTLIANSKMTAAKVSQKLLLPTDQWNFISLPFDVNVADIEYPEGTLWVIRKYSGADRAALTGNTWQNMTNGSQLKAGEGYILHCANENESTIEFVFPAVDNAQKNNLFANQDVVKELNTYNSEYAHNRSWNLVGNPYPSYYDTQSIEHNGVITVYNNDRYGYGAYTAYSLLDDDYVLRPNEAFFVQCPVDASSMTFKKEGRSHESGIVNNSMRAGSISSSRVVLNFLLTNDYYSDRARIVINPNAKMDYEISCDASKFMSDNTSVPQLYVEDNGIRYAIDERPIGDGIFNLVAYIGQAGGYTISLKTNQDKCVILTDKETGKEVNLAEDSYTFTAQTGQSEKHFAITIGDELTNIQSVDNSHLQKEATVYDLQGRKTNTLSKKGVYIIKQNGKSYKVTK